MKKQLKIDAVKQAPHLIWNSFIDVIARNYSEIEDNQRSAHLVFLYDVEVQNGGHMQYFENHRATRLNETMQALMLLGANCQATILEDAGRQFLSKKRKIIRSIFEYVEIAREGEFNLFDQRYHQCTPDLTLCLQAHLHNHLPDYIEFV
ncbi:DMP19 family protein [Acidicapsa dinghuensis]|uniref:DMP19 family protein n=1 Tax=Acidicapsa dinghuensis TaxID=2218256 RepID=A0ABW1EAP5_9BACT|nr:DMP19 family protein [Acidicapsa dinghuensis]